MSINFRILPALGLVYVRYGRVAKVCDSQTAIQQYLAHPDFRPGQAHLLDLSNIEVIENDYIGLFQLQLTKIETFLRGETQVMIVYYAPHPTAYEVARLSQNSWQGIPGVVPIIQEDEVQALSLLGLPHLSIAELLEPSPEIG